MHPKHLLCSAYISSQYGLRLKQRRPQVQKLDIITLVQRAVLDQARDVNWVTFFKDKLKMQVQVNIRVASAVDLRDLVDLQLLVKAAADELGGRPVRNQIPDTPDQRFLTFDFPDDRFNGLIKKIKSALRPLFTANAVHSSPPLIAIGPVD